MKKGPLATQHSHFADLKIDNKKQTFNSDFEDNSHHNSSISKKIGNLDGSNLHGSRKASHNSFMQGM